MLRVAAALAALSFALPACLNARSGAVQGTSDAVEDVAAEEDVANVATSACPGGCEDDDPCTADWCDEAAGACVHARVGEGKRAELPCLVDADCNAPCSQGTCHLEEDACGIIDAWCERVPIPDCQTSCSAAGLVSASTLGLGFSYAKVGGTAVAGDLRVCTGDCPCGTDLGLLDDDDGFVVMQGAEDEASYACEVDMCDPTLEVVSSCRPMHAMTAYWAWGAPIEVPASGIWDSDAPRPPWPGLMLEGWCLQTNAAGLVGRYTGRIAFATGSSATFAAEIVATNDGLALIVNTPDCCPSCDCDMGPVGSQMGPVTPHDGWVELGLDVDGVTLSATLRSNQNELRGPAQMAGDSDGLVPGGELTLTKLP